LAVSEPGPRIQRRHPFCYGARVSYLDAIAVSASVCSKGLLAFVLLRKTNIVLSLRSLGRRAPVA